MYQTSPIPTQHIADYYAFLGKSHPCLGHELLRRGYQQWSNGKVEVDLNNLFSLT